MIDKLASKIESEYNSMKDRKDLSYEEFKKFYMVIGQRILIKQLQKDIK